MGCHLAALVAACETDRDEVSQEDEVLEMAVEETFEESGCRWRPGCSTGGRYASARSSSQAMKRASPVISSCSSRQESSCHSRRQGSSRSCGQGSSGCSRRKGSSSSHRHCSSCSWMRAHRSVRGPRSERFDQRCRRGREHRCR